MAITKESVLSDTDSSRSVIIEGPVEENTLKKLKNDYYQLCMTTSLEDLTERHENSIDQKKAMFDIDNAVS